MIVDKACFERGCACYDDRVDGPGVEVVERPAGAVQVSVKEFVRTVLYKEDLAGRPMIWAQWPTQEETK